jgi:hypothetical protein
MNRGDTPDNEQEMDPVDPLSEVVTEEAGDSPADEAIHDSIDLNGDEPPIDGDHKTMVDLISELIAATGLLTKDKLAAVRTRAQRGSFAKAVLAAGLAPRVVADQHGLPYVDLQQEGVDPGAVAFVPRNLLARACALPYAVSSNRLKVAIADPTNVQAIDEIRLATRYAVDLAVAAREDIEVELRRIVRANEAWERTALLEEELPEVEEEADLEADDGFSDAPLV